MEKEKITLNIADYDNIKCRTCIYSVINGTMSPTCGKFKLKPRKVYYEGADCPEYSKKPQIKD